MFLFINDVSFKYSFNTTDTAIMLPNLIRVS
jgi:hypothetical protein